MARFADQFGPVAVQEPCGIERQRILPNLWIHMHRPAIPDYNRFLWNEILSEKRVFGSPEIIVHNSELIAKTYDTCNVRKQTRGLSN